MKQISEFEEFDYKSYTISTDLGSAIFHFDSGLISIQGFAYSDSEKRQIEVILEPEDTAEFNVTVGEMKGELTKSDFNYESELCWVEDIETETRL